MTEWIRGEESLEAEAAAQAVAEVLTLIRKRILADFESK